MTSGATTTSEEAERPRRRLPDRLALAYLGCVGVFSVWVSYASFRDRIRVPVFDDWRILDDFYSMSLMRWLVSNQNGHRTTFTFGLFALDYSFFDGRQDLLVVAMLATAWLAVACLYLALRGGGGLATPVSKVAFGFACFSIFWSGGAYNFLWGVCQGNLMIVLWLVLSLWCLVAYAQPGDRRPQLVALAALAAFFATFSLGQGIAIWMALIALALAARLGARVVTGLAAGFALTLAVYTPGLEAGGKFSFAASTAALRRPVELLEYVATFIGSLFARTAQGLDLVARPSLEPVSCLAGAIGLVGSASFAVWLLRRPSRAGREQLLGLGIMGFVVAAAVVVALARLRFGMVGDPLALRFVNWSATFWMGAVLAIAPLARGTLGPVSVALIVVLSLCMAPALDSLREISLKRKAAAEEASLGLLLGVADHRLADRMGALGHYDRFDRAARRLEQERRSFFASPWADLPGAPLVAGLVVVPSERCRGVMRTPRRFGVPAAGVYQIGGWVAERGRSAPSLVVVTDAAGIVRGLGSVRDGSGGMPSRLSSSGPAPLRWSGYLVGPSPAEPYVAYAVLSDGRSACRLGSSS